MHEGKRSGSDQALRRYPEDGRIPKIRPPIPGMNESRIFFLNAYPLPYLSQIFIWKKNRTNQFLIAKRYFCFNVKSKKNAQI